MFLWIIISFFLCNSWYFKECYGSEPCPSYVPLIHVCNDNELNNVYDVYVSTRYAPLQQAVKCACTITPSVSSENYTLNVLGASELPDDSIRFIFNIDNVTVIENSNFEIEFTTVHLTGDTLLTYSSPGDNTVNVCVYIAAASHEDMFSMVCNQPSVITKQTTISTASTLYTDTIQDTQTSMKGIHNSPEPTTSSSSHDTDGTSPTKSSVPGTESQTSSNTREDNMILIVGIAGGVVMVLNVVVTIGIVYCMRKSKAPPCEGSQPIGSSNSNNEGSNNMQLNQAYASLNDVPPSRSAYAPLAVSQDTMNDDTSPTSRYAYIMDNAIYTEVSVNRPASHFDIPGRPR